MAVASGDRITAALLRRLRPAYYRANATSALDGPSTQGTITGASVTLTTETAATWYVEAVYDFDNTASATGLMLGYCDVDGSVQGGQATCGDEVATDRHTCYQMWDGVFTSAGSHTIRLRGTVASGQSIRQDNTRIKVTVLEQL